jgi:hypothetical protein
MPCGTFLGMTKFWAWLSLPAVEVVAPQTDVIRGTQAT